MTGKIERPVTTPRGKVERPQVETPARTRPVARPVPSQKNAFSNDGPSALDSGSGGAHLARSAQPDALWGGGDRRTSNEPAELMKLTPAQQVEKLAQLRAQRDELHVKILERVIELDKKFEHAPTSVKADALKEYAENSEQLDPSTAEELRQMMQEADHAQHQINRLKQLRDGMPPSRNATADVKRQRAELNKELRAARNEQKAVVKEAVKVIDDQGLKIDRLAVTEQVIDPSAPKPGTEKSLLGMVKSFFSVSWVTHWLTDKVAATQSKKHDVELEKELQLQLLQDHKKEQAAKREGLKELALEASLRKR